jgi:hypothetical protein
VQEDWPERAFASFLKAETAVTTRAGPSAAKAFDSDSVSARPNGLGKRRVCHPELGSFAGEGSAFRKKAEEKSRFLTPFKNRTEFGMTYFESFRGL